MSTWLYDPEFWELEESDPKGPVELDALVSMIKDGSVKADVMVCRAEQDNWSEADAVEEIVSRYPPDLDFVARSYVLGCAPEKWPEDLWWVQEKVWRWIHHLPELAFRFVIRVIAQEPTDDVLEQLAAGPLEDLLDEHGEAVIELVEVEAARSARFRYCLAGVWRRKIPDEIWTRLTLALGEQERY